MTQKPYRPCVGIALFHADGRVFVGERIDTPGAWQMPQGGIDDGEDIKTAAYRELLEETGAKQDQADILRIADEAISYDLPAHLQDKLWGGRYAGQKQTWVAMRFKGHDQDININNHDPAEFSQWQWIDLDKTLDLIVPFKRETYQKIISLFSDLID